jgi:ATP-dependent Clp protease ATP-binding subunit ClpA
MPSFAQNLEKTLHNALQHATDRAHEYATLEHLLLALIDDDDAAEVMTACGVDLGELAGVVRQYLDQEYQSLKTEDNAEPQATAGFQRVIQRAILHVQSSGRDTVTGANVLVALFSERDSYAVARLKAAAPQVLMNRKPRPRKSRTRATRRNPRSTSSASTSTRRRWTARSIR